MGQRTGQSLPRFDVEQTGENGPAGIALDDEDVFAEFGERSCQVQHGRGGAFATERRDHQHPASLGAHRPAEPGAQVADLFQMGSGGRQSVTGLVVNGDAPPRATRKLRRQLRSAIHKLKTGKPLQDGESLARLIGYAAFVHMSQPELGRRMLAELHGLDGAGANGQPK